MFLKKMTGFPFVKADPTGDDSRMDFERSQRLTPDPRHASRILRIV